MKSKKKTLKKSSSNKKIKTRKELRKEKRLEKKQKKNDYFATRKQDRDNFKNQKNKNKKGSNKNNIIDSDEDVHDMKDIVFNKRKNQFINKKIVKKVPEVVETSNSILENRRKKEKQMQNNIESNKNNVRKKQLVTANLYEDREIKKLEKQLNLNKRKSKKLPSSFVSDGLDYLLELCDSEKRKEIGEQVAKQQFSDSESEFENDLALITGKTKNKKNKTKEKNNKTENPDEDDNEEDMFDEEMESNDEFDEEFSNEDDDEDEEFDSNEGDDDLESNGDEEFNSNDEFNEEFDSDESDDEEFFDTEVNEENKHLKSNLKKRKNDNEKISNNKKVKFIEDVNEKKTDKVLSKEERMKQLMGFVEKEESKLKEKDKDTLTKTDKVLIKEERMKKLMGFVEKETVKDNVKKVDKKLSKEERMKQLLGFVENESNEVDDDDDDDLSMDESDFGEDDDEEDVVEDNDSGTNKRSDGTWEDIYGRLRDKDGNVIENNTPSSKYVPPHLRNVSSDNNEKLALLKRKLKGQLNRLTENNIKSISTAIEQFYVENSRHDMNVTLLSIIKESLLSETSTPEKMVIEHVLLIAVLHANVGTEVGATLLQHLIEDYSKFYIDMKYHIVENKQLDNIVLMLIYFYQFKIISNQILYNILNQLVDTFNEKTIEILLNILKAVGLLLRKDNAVEFKSILLKIQSKSNENEVLRDKPRTKFMLEILLAVKNNNVHKIPGYDVTVIQRIKSNLKFLLRPSCYISELNISMEDLLKAGEKGRWWIVGSAWTGGPSEDTYEKSSKSLHSGVTQFSQEILELARKQRMNTDIRRNVFCILMTSEDYLDAYEKLLKLGVKQDQYEEIINVIVHCLLKEKTYNPYYYHLSNHFISSNRKFRMMIQYCIWDKFKLLKDMNIHQLNNLAKYLSALFINDSLPMSVLKVIEFTELQKYHITLIRQIFLSILLLKEEEIIKNIFVKVTKGSNLNLLKQGLILFLNHFVLRKINENDESYKLMKRNAIIVEDMLAGK